LILLSGPEPQRTLLADMLWQQMQHYKGKIVFVEGSDKVTDKGTIPAHITYHKRITKEILQPLMAAANMVVCRSGYSTLMDLVVLNKKAILIPTPGQTEQEFLGRHLHKEGVFYHAPQKGLNLLAALKGAETFSFHKLPLANAQYQYKAVLENWLQKL
jgi:UDP-N-acetylglucosamine:LPS N-acetylglucosamine transferase